MNKLTQDELMSLVKYDKDTGVFTWVKPRIGIRVGDRAGGLQLDGYRCIGIRGKRYHESRLAWLYVKGYFPENELDHINRDRSDNRWRNLREATRMCNVRNCGVGKNNTTGVTGVGYRDAHKKYVARIGVGYRSINLGMFTHKSDAVKARWEAEKKYDFPRCNTTSSAFVYLQNRGTHGD